MMDETVRYLDPSTDPQYTEIRVAPALLHVQSLVRQAFKGDDPYHGVEHAMDVEKNVFLICEQPDIEVSNIEKFLLRAAALLHDIGYSAYQPTWSRDRREHVEAGIRLVTRLLKDAPIFRAEPDLTLFVLYLIAYHDDTNYKYPTMARDGEVVPVHLGEYGSHMETFEQLLDTAEQIRLRLMLAILREADAMAATDTAGAQRTYNYSVGRGLPIFASGNPLNAWCWEESAIGNVRVGARRLLIDAVSAEGRKLARAHFAAMEAFVEAKCAEHNVPYIPDGGLTLKPDTSAVALKATEEPFRIIRYQGWDVLEATLREVALNGDRSILPYAKATIRPRRMAICDLRPSAYYALRKQIAGHYALHEALQREYVFSLFDLTGFIDYVHDGDGVAFRMAPPLIETYHEPTENAAVSVIVDGLHRVLLARELGIESIWVIEITDIPPQYPLVPLPLRWEDVELCDSVPPTHAKRKFRFPTLEQFPDVSEFSSVHIDESNYLYFFYRDLGALGSDGIRQAR